jgi:probable rRNA maturation factor
MSPPRSEARYAQPLADFAIEQGLDAAWDEPRMTALVAAILARHFPQGGTFTISLHLVSDAAIRALNAEHRGKDIHTDVLSFPLVDPETQQEQEQAFILPPGEPIQLGDVVVSYPRALAQAEEFGHSPERELAYLVAHGVLHVLGYDHETAPDQARMRHLEEEALQPLGLTR